MRTLFVDFFFELHTGPEKETDMIFSRVHYIHFRNKVTTPDSRLSFLKCPNCFARLLLGPAR